MVFRLRKRSIDDLDVSHRLNRFTQAPVDLREQVQVLVVDDQPFEPQANLEAHGFKLTVLNGIGDIAQTKPYPIVLCDLMGVGQALHECLQGAYTIREIKKNYPEKVVFAYTGGSVESRITREAHVYADHYMRKDAGPDEWCEKLDAVISDLANPVVAWKDFRLRLLATGIPISQLAILEDGFVRSYPRGSTYTRDYLEGFAGRKSLGVDARSVLSSFVGSALFALLF